MSDHGTSTQTNDEIDLREIVSIVIDRWYWIAIGLVVSSVIGVSLALNQESQFRTEFRAISAPSNQFNTMNEMTRVASPSAASSSARGVVEITGFQLMPERVIADLSNRLSSFQNFESFIQRNPEIVDLEPTQSLQQYFSQRFSFDLTAEMRLRATMLYGSGMNGPALLNTYINETADSLWHGYLATLERQNQTSIRRLENRLEDQIETLVEQRLHRLHELRQAATIAKRLEIELPTTPGQLGRQPTGTEVVYANISSGDEALPLYFFGFKALEAEADILNESLNDGLVNEAILESQEALSAQRRLARMIQASEFLNNTGLKDLPPAERLTTVMDYAIEPDFPTGRSRSLVVLVSVFLGGFIGFMMTFVGYFAQSVRAYRRQRT
ncbi:MAG: hypothetical protein LAT65_18845 [Saccharospirillum sp.]|nr:hypothetical protein [Saccharospirillum sp.]